MKANNALVFLWNGNEPSNNTIARIAEMLAVSGICDLESLSIIYKDEKGIANTLLRDCIKDNAVAVIDSNSEVDKAVKNAVIYIGKKFENYLIGKNRDLTKFGIELSKTVMIAQQRISFNPTNSGDEILTAIEIISTANTTIPATLAKKYHFTQNVVDVIKTVYHSSRINIV